MSMSHIYQPVMLIELLNNQGKASVTQIAQAILNKDPSQIEYYSQIVKRMVGDVLTNKRKITTKDKEHYLLQGVQSLSQQEITELITLCESKINEYELKRQGAQWQHRRRGRRPVSGTIRYEVLKRAKGRCELCGISNEEKNLEVDHITPKSLGGKDDIANYQALCFTCNAQKNNKDDTDFRNINAQYEHREKDCLFCQIQTDDRERVEDENTLAYAIRDGFEVTKHHTLFIPKRHIKDYFGLTQAEINAINQLIESQKEFLDNADSSIDGYNIGMNCGEAAGQTIFHCHVHLIPRRKGDVDNPRGGIRHVIPEKGFYKS
ncbi:HIT domain-containing protein [Polynucleobacter sp. Latsch14-2]|jgi:diadenosine tetraphosphate (Ap4A) HIT family hydrolase/5-methylcytosine-specific restriction endonuclease McrA|uniref:HIT domain-containing protein n=1 Tax=Polynucleobacter sp. Latsch14-2 TaxID=2576920 RepID=UPI001C0C0B53|nr:HIT domain-containing protein [Polynucleobacter sp. Latsch14-2]